MKLISGYKDTDEIFPRARIGVSRIYEDIMYTNTKSIIHGWGPKLNGGVINTLFFSSPYEELTYFFLLVVYPRRGKVVLFTFHLGVYVKNTLDYSQVKVN